MQSTPEAVAEFSY